MMMNPTKKPSQSIAADEAELAALDRRIPEMAARANEVVEIQLIAENTAGAPEHSVASSDQAAAQAMIAGAPFVATRERPVSLLNAIVAEKKTLAHALKIANARRDVLMAERAERIWAAHHSEIAAIEKRRMMLVFDLQRTNRAREKLREKITQAGGAGYLSTDGAEFLGFGDEYAEIKWAANRLISDGIATKAEIEKARSDG